MFEIEERSEREVFLEAENYRLKSEVRNLKKGLLQMELNLVNCQMLMLGERQKQINNELILEGKDG